MSALPTHSPGGIRPRSISCLEAPLDVCLYRTPCTLSTHACMEFRPTKPLMDTFTTQKKTLCGISKNRLDLQFDSKKSGISIRPLVSIGRVNSSSLVFFFFFVVFIQAWSLKLLFLLLWEADVYDMCGTRERYNGMNGAGKLKEVWIGITLLLRVRSLCVLFGNGRLRKEPICFNPSRTS